MAKTILTGAQLKVVSSDDSVVHDLEDQTQSLTLNYSAAEQNAPDMTDDTDVVIPGSLKSWSLDATIYQSYQSSAEVDAVLFDQVGKKMEVQIVPDSSQSVGSNNPAFYGEAVLTSYPPISGSIGDVRTVDVTWTAAGTLSRNNSEQV